jgi:hypothetical membrane protein
MNISRLINLALLVVGGMVAVYAQAQEAQNQYILIGGIVLLMIGIYRISRNISSKNDSDDDVENDTNQ